jgi:hypothetical protein
MELILSVIIGYLVGSLGTLAVWYIWEERITEVARRTLWRWLDWFGL